MESGKNKAAASAIIGIYRLLLFVFVMGCLYYGQSLLIPLTLAALLTFLTSPLVAFLERWVGRIIAVFIVVTVMFLSIGFVVYILSNQVIGFSDRLPSYKVNIQNKLSAFDLPQDSAFLNIFSSIEKFQHTIPSATPTSKSTVKENTTKEEPFNVIQSSTADLSFSVKDFVAYLLSILGSFGLVLLLFIFMLFTREDLRGRFIRLIGPHRISATTKALDDASERVTQYLIMQLLINFFYGVLVTIGLYVIGIPYAILWGCLALLLRFVPYVGIWIAAILPFIVALAVSTSWTIPLITLVMFVILDLVTGNIIEPLLYSTRTGVSAFALIVSAIFWTLLWGPVGLLLSTPLTVCLIVMGRHIPNLEFLNVLLSDDESLALYEEYYQRLIAHELSEANAVITNYLQSNPAASLYDSILIPIMNAAATDNRNGILEDDQLSYVNQNIQDMLEDLPKKSVLSEEPKKEEENLSKSHSILSVLSIPAASEHDELSSVMLEHVLLENDIAVKTMKINVQEENIAKSIKKEKVDVICICVVSSSSISRARTLCKQIHEQYPELKIVIGLWGAKEMPIGMDEKFQKAGAYKIVFSLDQALAEFNKLRQVQTVQ